MTIHGPIYQMVEKESDKAFQVHMEDTWNNMNQVAWETLRDLLPHIQELEPVWTPVSETLPFEEDEVMVTTSKGYRYFAELRDGVWFADGDELTGVEFWMSIPQPPNK